MAQICPRCGGMEIGCPVCGLPPRHARPFDRRAMRASVFEFLTDWPVQGIDVSGWNGIMDFSITKKKCQFAIVRLGYGNGWKDARCDTYRRDLIANDIPYGVYWYCKPGESFLAHAEGFAEVASEFPFQLYMDEDYEQTSKDKLDTLTWIINMDVKLKTLMNRITEPYSSAGFWNESVAPNAYFQNNQWVANWTTASSPYMPNGWTWTKGDKWQYSADGNGKAKEYGMVSDGDVDMDLNRYYGTVDEFNAQYKTHILPIGQVPVIERTKMAVIVASLNIRSAPNKNARIIGSLKSGDVIEVLDAGGTDAWIKHNKGWSCYKNSDGKYLEPKS